MLIGFVGSLCAWLRRLRNKKKGDELQAQTRRQAAPAAPWSASVAGGAIEDGLDTLSQWLTQLHANEASRRDFQNVAVKLAAIAALMQQRLAAPMLDHAATEPRQLDSGETIMLRPIDMDTTSQGDRAPARQPSPLVIFERNDATERNDAAERSDVAPADVA
jgi:hypothetical protein